jgi:hypothetical protein
MRFQLDPKPKQNLAEQHVWFAWHPVVSVNTSTKRRERVWLEYVYRTGTRFDDSLGGGWSWEYNTPMVWYP